MKWRLLDLFSGIGGFSKGLEDSGNFETVAFCEIEDYPRRVLRKHWPEVPIYDDVRTLTARRLAADGIGVDAICGGFPCQSVSHAGKRKGAADHRWLWPEYLRLIKELRPAWVIGENVVGIVSLELDGVLADLDSIGYASRAFDIPSCGVGLPTVERHIWVVATPDGERFQGQQPGTLSDFPRVARELLRSDQRIPERWAVPEARVCRADEGIPYRVDRVAAIGNAVPPQIPEIIGKAIGPK